MIKRILISFDLEIEEERQLYESLMKLKRNRRNYYIVNKLLGNNVDNFNYLNLLNKFVDFLTEFEKNRLINININGGVVNDNNITKVVKKEVKKELDLGNVSSDVDVSSDGDILKQMFNKFKS